MKINRKDISLAFMIVAVLLLFVWTVDATGRRGLIAGVYNYSTVDFQSLEYDVAELSSMRLDALEVFYKDKTGKRFGSIGNLKNSEEDLVFATNGGIFEVGFEPLGLYVEDGDEVAPLNLRSGAGNFYFKPNGVFAVRRGGAEIVETSEYEEGSDVRLAIQSGPMLVLDGEIHPYFVKNDRSRKIRSGVGVDSLGNVKFAITNEPANLYEFASFFRDELGCDNALFLDGTISEMYVPGYREDVGGSFSVIIGIDGA